MKAISIRQPWAHLITTGEKTVECRSWQTNYRGDLLICSSALPKIKNTIPGHALCVVRLDSIEPFKRKHLYDACFDEMPDGKEFAWHLTDMRIIKPFPVKGKLNFFNVPDEQIEIIVRGDEDVGEERANEIYRTYIEPYLYKGKG